MPTRSITTPDLKAVAKIVTELRRRIHDDRKYLAQNEIQTRVLLIDPLLRMLGWDPENSDEVQLEFRTRRGRVDYALMLRGEPVAVIEAKKLEDEIGREVRLQLFEYANAPRCSAVRLAAATDGDAWFFWRRSDGWRNRWNAKVKISTGRMSKVASALAEYLSPATLGVVDSTPPRSAKGRPKQTRRRKWYPLVSELPDGIPTSVRLADEPPTHWVSWRGLYEDVAEFLYATGFIDETDAPVYVANGKYCAINDEPVHPGPNGKQFGRAVQIGESMWLDTDVYGSKLREYAARLLRKFHNDPECVQLRYD